MTNSIKAIANSKLALSFIACIFVAFLSFAAPSTAKAGGVNGLEVGGAFGWQGELFDNGTDMNGIVFRLNAGYRFKDWVGIFINQDLGGTWTRKHGGGIRGKHFAGATIFSANFFYEISQIELFGLLGIGALYHGKFSERYKNGGSTVFAHTSDGAFAFRMGIGGSFKITNNILAGINFDYTVGAFDDVDNILDLMLHIRYKF